MATTEVVRLVNEPETLEFKRDGKLVQAVKLRFVIKATSKSYKDRFVNGLLFGKRDMEDALRLAKGDRVQVSGTLCLGEYYSKKEKCQKDQEEMGYGWRIERVIESKTFFGPKPGAEPEAEPEVIAPAPGPLDDLDLDT